MDEQEFFGSVRKAFGNNSVQESEEEKKRRLKAEALKRVKSKSLEPALTDFFQKQMDK